VSANGRLAGLEKILTAEDAEETQRAQRKAWPRISGIKSKKRFVRVDRCKSVAALFEVAHTGLFLVY